jgi:hypothetical protein
MFRFAKFESESLELRPKAFRSFLVIIYMVGLLGATVNIKNLTDGQGVRLKDCLLECLAILLSEVLKHVASSLLSLVD